jgi:hypothetical protein
VHHARDGDANALRWKKTYEAAIFELDPTKVQLRISEARRAILDRVEQLLTHPWDSEQRALNEALRNLRALRKMSEVGNDGQTKMQI